MKKVKLNHRQMDDRRGKQRSHSIATFLQTMLKLENITVLVLIVLVHQIHGINSQSKFQIVLYRIVIVKEVLFNPDVAAAAVTMRKSQFSIKRKKRKEKKNRNSRLMENKDSVNLWDFVACFNYNRGKSIVRLLVCATSAFVDIFCNRCRHATS